MKQIKINIIEVAQVIIMKQPKQQFSVGVHVLRTVRGGDGDTVDVGHVVILFQSIMLIGKIIITIKGKFGKTVPM